MENKKGSWFKNFYPAIKNLLRQSADTSQVDNEHGYIKYGVNNDFPLLLAKMVEESPTGSACISTLADFIEGNGFSDEKIGSLVINGKGETLAELHAKVSESFATNEGFAINVKYNKMGGKTELYFLPFENCRLGLPDKKGKISKIYYNPYFGTDKHKTPQDKSYNTYDPNPTVIQAQIRADGEKYLGQVFYYGTTKALHRFYPEPKYFSASEWFEVDHLIGEYWKNNLDQNFLQSVVFKMIGDPNEPANDPDHMVNDEDGNLVPDPKYTRAQAWSDMMSQEFAGAKRVGNIMTFWANTKEEYPEIQAFPTDAKSDVFKLIEEMTAKKITVATGVPGILANISNGVNLGSDGNEIQAAIKLMQQRVVKRHHVLERTYTELLKGWKEDISLDGGKINIVHYDPYPEDVTVDQKIWDELTAEERREWIRKNTDIKLIEVPKPEQPAPNPPAPVPPPAPTEAKLLNAKNLFYNSYPEGAKKNAARAIEHRATSEVKCGSKFAWQIADNIANGRPIEYKIVKRIGNYLKKHEGFKNNKWTDGCEAVLYHSWGGKEMQDWCEMKVNEVG